GFDHMERATHILEGYYFHFRLNKFGSGGIFIDDILYLGVDANRQTNVKSKNGFYLVEKYGSNWISRNKSHEILTNYLMVADNERENISSIIIKSGEFMEDIFKANAPSKFTLCYFEKNMLQKLNWFTPAARFKFLQKDSHHKSVTYLASHIASLPKSQETHLVASKNGCFYLRDALYRVPKQEMRNLRVCMVNPRFSMLAMANRLKESNIQYKDFGYVLTATDYQSRLRGFNANNQKPLMGQYADVDDRKLEKESANTAIQVVLGGVSLIAISNPSTISRPGLALATAGTAMAGRVLYKMGLNWLARDYLRSHPTASLAEIRKEAQLQLFSIFNHFK
ncbi:hypothetical protein, partial [Aliikangiella maris]